jgi:hypothetical protein
MQKRRLRKYGFHHKVAGWMFNVRAYNLEEAKGWVRERFEIKVLRHWEWWVVE